MDVACCRLVIQVGVDAHADICMDPGADKPQPSQHIKQHKCIYRIKDPIEERGLLGSMNPSFEDCGSSKDRRGEL